MKKSELQQIIRQVLQEADYNKQDHVRMQLDKELTVAIKKIVDKYKYNFDIEIKERTLEEVMEHGVNNIINYLMGDKYLV